MPPLVKVLKSVELFCPCMLLKIKLVFLEGICKKHQITPLCLSMPSEELFAGERKCRNVPNGSRLEVKAAAI
jgi:hypothetical protein